MNKSFFLIFRICIYILLVLSFMTPDDKEMFAYTNDIPIDAEHFPDRYFRKILSRNFDADKDGYIDDSMSVKSMKIYANFNDLTSCEGIELFPNLKDLDVRQHKISFLDVSNNTKLESLIITGRSLLSLQLGEGRELKKVEIQCKNLEELSVGSDNGIQSLWISNSHLTAFNGASFPEIQTLGFGTSKTIIDFNVRNNSSLETLSICSKKIENIQLDLYSKPLLRYFRFTGRGLRRVDLSKNKHLYNIMLDDRDLSDLVLPRSSNLQELYLYSSKLRELNLLKYPKLNTIWLRNNHKLKKLTLKGNKNLRSIKLDGNALTELDCSGMTKIYDLNASGNRLNKVVLPKSKMLHDIYLEDNNLKELDLSKTPNLSLALLDGNLFKTLDFSKHDQIVTIHARRNPRLKKVYVHPSLYSKKYKRVYRYLDIEVDGIVAIK